MGWKSSPQPIPYAPLLNVLPTLIILTRRQFETGLNKNNWFSVERKEEKGQQQRVSMGMIIMEANSYDVNIRFPFVRRVTPKCIKPLCG